MSSVRDDLIKNRDSLQACLNDRLDDGRLVVYCLDKHEDCKTMKKVIRALNTVIEYCYYLEDEYDEHIGCSAYPNCDILPNGCVHSEGGDVEQYGYKD